MECVLEKILSFGEGAGSSNLVIGRVGKIHIEDTLYKDGKIDFGKLKPVGRLSGTHYARMSDLFTLNSPKDRKQK